MLNIFFIVAHPNFAKWLFLHITVSDIIYWWVTVADCVREFV